MLDAFEVVTITKAIEQLKLVQTKLLDLTHFTDYGDVALVLTLTKTMRHLEDLVPQKPVSLKNV